MDATTTPEGHKVGTSSCQDACGTCDRTFEICSSWDHLINAVALRIRQSLELQAILQATVNEIYPLLGCDRVCIARFTPDGSSQIAVEAVAKPQWSILNRVFNDLSLGINKAGQHPENHYWVIQNLATAHLPAHHTHLLQQLQVQASLVIPILDGATPWGLLLAHQCQSPRTWRDVEIEGLQLLAIQVGIAIHQATLIQQLKTTTASLEATVAERTRDLAIANEQLRQEMYRYRQTAETLQQQETQIRQLATIVETSQDAIISTTLDGSVLSWNRAAETLFGYPATAIIGQSLTIIIPPEDQATEQHILDRLRQGEQIATYETQLLHRNGQTVDVAITLSPLQDPIGQIIGASKIVRDISTRKQEERRRQAAELALQDSQRQFQAFMDYAPLLSWITSTDGILEYANAGWLEFVGHTHQSVLGRSLEELFSPEIAQEFRDNNQRVIAANSVIETLEHAPALDGAEHTFLIRKFPIYQDQQIVAVGGIGVDVSDRQRFETALQDSETRYRLLIDHLPVGAVVHNPDTSIAACNAMSAELLGLSMDQIQGKTAFDPDWKFLRNDAEHTPMPVEEYPVNQILASGQPLQNFVLAVQSPRHSTDIWLLVNGYPLHTPDGTLQQIVITFTDITERKRAEAALRASEARWQFALEGAGDGLWDWDARTNEVFFSSQWKSMLGYADDEIGNTLDEWSSRVHPDDLEPCYADLQRHFKRETAIYQNEHRMRCRDGHYTWILDRGKVIEWAPDGQPQRVIGTHTDISDRKQAEMQLRTLSDRLTLALEAGAIGTWDWNMLDEASWDDRMYAIYGLDPQHQTATYEIWRSLILPEDLEQTEQSFQAATQGLAEFEAEFRICRPDGEVRWIRATAMTQQNADGTVYRMTGINYDITERKLAEENLRQSEATNRALIQAIPDFLARMRQDGLNLESFNTENVHCLQPSERPLEGSYITDFMPLEIAQERLQLAQRAIATGTLQRHEYSFTENGHTFYEEARIIPLWADEVLIVVRDITDQKQAEVKLRNLSTRLALAVKSANIGIWDWDIERDLLIWDDRMYQIYGLTPAEFRGCNAAWATQLHPEDAPMVQTLSQQLLSNPRCPSFNVQYRILWPDGTVRWVQSCADIQRNADGQACRIIGVNFDITEIKQTTQDLNNAKEQLELVLQASSEGFWDWDLNTNNIYFSPRWKEMLGYTDAELENSLAMWESLILEEDRLVALELIENYNSGRVDKFETVQRFRHKDGSIVSILSRAIHLKDSGGHVVRMVGSHLDMTQTIQIQQALKKSEMQLSGILNSSLDGIMAFRSIRNELGQIVDFEWILSNPTACDIVGRPQDTLIGQRLLRTLPGQRDAGLFTTYIQVVELGEPARRQFYYNHDGLNSWFESICVKLGDGFAMTFRDITQIKQSEQQIQQVNQQLEIHVDSLKKRNSEMLMLSKTSDFLQACLSIPEACMVISTLVRPLFPGCSGSIYITNASRNRLEQVASWGAEETAGLDDFAPHDCWGLRRGRLHLVHKEVTGLRCHHSVGLAHNAETLCIPMIAQSETLGLFYLYTEEEGVSLESQQQLAQTVAEQIGLAIANLHLRETLQNQSIRDTLTGLFNRRYLEESLQREIMRAQRNQSEIGLIMLDVDHFKQFNDNHGHEAGDLVLQAMGQLLREQVRGSDIACRYGGEEFVLVFPDSTLDETETRANDIRAAIQQLRVSLRGLALSQLTASFGVVSFPRHGMQGAALLQAADAALYRAKALGRNQVILAP